MKIKHILCSLMALAGIAQAGEASAVTASCDTFHRFYDLITGSRTLVSCQVRILRFLHGFRIHTGKCANSLCQHCLIVDQHGVNLIGGRCP